eukprot:TRINITY_DN12916_c0_g1_i1.p1 TRINITY_DN12916_c0_g1~~TRINITY_DN12916_c0_g1_i1.p1  ORF type:complete len:533 (+),score=53.50 TRINITY_DN12916_c0_g1_i1:48-1646(+)
MQNIQVICCHCGLSCNSESLRCECAQQHDKEAVPTQYRVRRRTNPSKECWTKGCESAAVECCRIHGDRWLCDACTTFGLLEEGGVIPMRQCKEDHLIKKTRKIHLHASKIKSNGHELRSAFTIAVEVNKRYSRNINLTFEADSSEGQHVVLEGSKKERRWKDGDTAENLARVLVGLSPIPDSKNDQRFSPTSIINSLRGTTELVNMYTRPMELTCSDCMVGTGGLCDSCSALFNTVPFHLDYKVRYSKGSVGQEAAAILLRGLLTGMHKEKRATLRVDVQASHFYRCPKCLHPTDNNQCLQCSAFNTSEASKKISEKSLSVLSYPAKMAGYGKVIKALEKPVEMVGTLNECRCMLSLENPSGKTLIPAYLTEADVRTIVKSVEVYTTTWSRQRKIAICGHAVWCNKMCLGKCPGGEPSVPTAIDIPEPRADSDSFKEIKTASMTKIGSHVVNGTKLVKKLSNETPAKTSFYVCFEGEKLLTQYKIVHRGNEWHFIYCFQNAGVIGNTCVDLTKETMEDLQLFFDCKIGVAYN